VRESGLSQPGRPVKQNVIQCLPTLTRGGGKELLTYFSNCANSSSTVRA
jgi:hypothetical protein